MEIEKKITKNKEGITEKVESIRHWKDTEVKEAHKSQGKSWRSNNSKLRVLPATTSEYRNNYDNIFKK